MSGSTQFNAGQRVQAATTDAQLAQPWNAMGLLASWTNFGAGFVTCQYRLLNQVSCEVVGTIKASSTIASGTQISTLPSGFYNPNVITGFALINTGVGSTVFVTVGTTGAVKLNGAATSGGIYYFHEIIPLDA